MKILTNTELTRQNKVIKGVNSPSDSTESLNVSEIAEKGGKFVYKTKDGEKEIKVESGLKKVVIALSKEDWVVNGDKFTYTITPELLTLPPSVTYGIEMQVFNYNIMMWERVAVTPNIDQEGNIIITSLTRLECNVIVTSGLILPPPKPSPMSKILGVDQVGRENPLGLPRTDGAVGMTYTLKTVGNNQVYKSDFDKVYPYSNIKEVTDSNGNVFIRIPKFYHKYTLNGDGTYKIQICGIKSDETWQTCFINGTNEIDYVDVGKYEASLSNSKICSVSNSTVLTSAYFESLRNFCTSNGIGYHMFDIWIYQIIQLLFLIEFATTDSQSILAGRVQGKPIQITGSCNGIDTGSPVSVADGTHGCVYRGIENVYGNYMFYCDGIKFKKTEVSICNNISNYDKWNEYKTSGTTKYSNSLDEYISKNVPCQSLNSQIMLPISTTASDKTYYCDTFYNSQNRFPQCLQIGKGFSNNGSGLWCWVINHVFEDSGSGSSSDGIGRLCRKPIAGTNFD